MPHDLLTVSEAAELTRWAPATIYSKVSRGHLPHVKLGRRVLFRRANLMKLFRDVPARNFLGEGRDNA